jgi:hypothetical protein
MARKTIAELLAEVQANFPDNNTGAITPAIIRAFFNDLIESFGPAFAIASRQTPLPLGVVGAAPVVIPNYNGIGAAQAPWTIAAGLGTLTWPDFPNAANVTVQATLELAANDAVELELYVNGTPTGYIKQAVAGEGAGAGNPVSVTFGGIVTNKSSASIYDVRIRSLVGNASPTLNYITVTATSITVR